jgi:hypothetical protein
MSNNRIFVMAVAGCLLLLPAGACGVAERVDKSRILAQEMQALQRLQSIQNAEVQYSSLYGQYASSLAQLGPSTTGTSSAQGADLIPSELALGVKDGYRFRVEGDGMKFSIEARPVDYGKSGTRSFYTDQSLMIRQNSSDAPATVDSPALTQ